MELCGWGRYFATAFTFGAPCPAVSCWIIARAGCILFWGYNPSLARIIHADCCYRGAKGGARLIVA